jgi:hypothetical protein
MQVSQKAVDSWSSILVNVARRGQNGRDRPTGATKLRRLTMWLLREEGGSSVTGVSLHVNSLNYLNNDIESQR